MDMDMELIESFVRYVNYPTVNNISSVFEYYISRLRSYWEKCKENIAGMQVEGMDVDFLDIIRSNMSQYEETFFEKLDSIIEDFYKTKVIKEHLILDLIMHIVNINCLVSDPDKYEGIKNRYNKILRIVGDKYKFCFVFNDSGYFYINSYMYALFNGVLILGIPSGYENMFDGQTDCGRFFIAHDLLHTDSIVLNISHIDELKKRYYRVMKGDYTKEEKECVALGVFLLVHEYPIASSDIVDYDKLKTFISKEQEDQEFEDLFTNFTIPLRDVLYNGDKDINPMKFVLNTCNTILNG